MIWIEQFRPQTLSEVVGQSDIVSFLSHMQVVQDIPHLLMVGPPGVGKTTCAHALANDLNLPIKEYNASNDRGIDFVRNVIAQEAKFLPQYNDRKIIFLDEADSMTPDAQFALRRIMEEWAAVTIFVLSCNYSGKIIPAIRNRTIELKFKELNPESLKSIAKRICESENRDIPNNEDLEKLVMNSGGSARSFTDYLFQYLVGGIIPESTFNVKGYFDAVKTWNEKNLKTLLDQTSYQELLKSIINVLISGGRSEKADAIMLKLGDYLILGPNPDEYLGKMVVSLYLNRMLNGT